MKNLTRISSLLLLSSATNALAQNEEIKFGPAPDWAEVSEPLPVPEEAGGIVFIRKQDTIVHLDETGQQYFQDQIFRILQPQALKAGNVSIVWNPASGQPTVHALRILRDGESTDVLENSSFEILRREDQLETAMLDGMLTAVLRVPDLRVGDDLQFSFTIPSHDPTLRDKSFGVMFLSAAPPEGRMKLTLTWADGQKPSTLLTEDIQSIAEHSERSIEVSFDNPDAISAPQDAPPRYSWARIIEYSDFATWGDVSKEFESLFATASQLSSESKLREEAERIANAHSTETARAQAALELVQRQVRYIFVGLNGGNFTPATADETWDRRYGDCKGKTAMLLALLHELGIESEAVLVNNSGGDDGLDLRLPNPGMFDHVLVRAKIDGKTFWLDGTMPDVVEMDEEPIVPYRWVLPLSTRGHDLEQLAQYKPDLPLEMGIVEIDARAGFDQPARMVRTIVNRGIVGVIEYGQFSSISASQLEAALRDSLIGSGQWYDIESVDYRFDRATQASILKITGTAPVDWDNEGDGRFDLTLPGGGFTPPSRRQRPSGQDQDAPYYLNPAYSCYTTTVRLPDDTETENWGFNSTFDTMLYGKAFYRMIEKRNDRTIRMVRGAKVIDHEISRKRAERDNARLADFDNSMARIEYDPSRTYESWGDLKPVPATFEYDWATQADHCLPADILALD